jgi:hypothetical protein
MRHLTQLPLILAAFSCGAAQLANAQLTRAPRTAPTVIVGPSSLAAVSTATAQVTLIWPAVPGAESYKVTRIQNTGDAEVAVAQYPATGFVFEGASCVAGSSTPNCVFLHPTPDISKQLIANPPGVVRVISGALYTYRVWAIFPGPVVSPPSPPATVRVR